MRWRSRKRCSGRGRNLTPYQPLVEAWSFFSEDAQNWTDRDGPNIPMEDLVELLPWEGFGPVG